MATTALRIPALSRSIAASLSSMAAAISSANYEGISGYDELHNDLC
jgi:hypothetical protein